MATETTKIKTVNKIFMCFRPVAMDGPSSPSFDLRTSGDQVFSNELDSRISATAVPLQDSSKISEHEKSSRPPRKSAGRIFSTLLNAAFFDTKLKKKLRNRKVRQDPSLPDGGKLPKTSKFPYVTRFTKKSDVDDTDPDFSVSLFSLTSSSSSSSTSTFISRSSTSSSGSSMDERSCELTRKSSCGFNSLVLEQNGRFVASNNFKEEPRRKRHGIGFSSSCYGLLLLLISIFLVIFSGKLYAIFFTSTLFYLAPRQDPKRYLSEEVKSANTDSPQLKKKVIIKGLLEFFGRKHRSNC